MIGIKPSQIDEAPLARQKSTLQKTFARRWWSKKVYSLNHIIAEPISRVLHYLKDGSARSFVSEELMHISKNA